MTYNKQEKQEFKIFKALFLLSGILFLILFTNLFTISDDYNIHKVIIGSIGCFGFLIYTLSTGIIPVIIRRKTITNEGKPLKINYNLLKSLSIIVTLTLLVIVLILLLIYMPSISVELITSLLFISSMAITHIVLLVKYKSVYYKNNK